MTALDKLRAIDEAAHFGEMVIPPDAKFARDQLAALAKHLRPLAEALEKLTEEAAGMSGQIHGEWCGRHEPGACDPPEIEEARAVLAKLSKTLGTGEEALK